MRNWLRDKRKAKGLTMAELAQILGISESYYCLIESGERRPSPEVAKKIAHVLVFKWTQFFEDGADKTA